MRAGCVHRPILSTHAAPFRTIRRTFGLRRPTAYGNVPAKQECAQMPMLLPQQPAAVGFAQLDHQPEARRSAAEPQRQGAGALHKAGTRVNSSSAPAICFARPQGVVPIKDTGQPCDSENDSQKSAATRNIRPIDACKMHIGMITDQNRP
jgi:hypothetical protein